MFETITVIIDGAFEEEYEFTDYLVRNAYLADLRSEAKAVGFTAEVYSLEHPHEPGIECECIQYATCHKPLWTFPADAAPTGW